MKIKIFIISIISLLSAGIAKAAIVPCGPGFPSPDDKCQFCHLFTLFDNILDFVFIDLIPPIAIFAIVFGGVYFLISTGNPQHIAKAKGIFTSVVIGLVIIYGAWLLINVFFTTIGISEGEFGTNIKNWFEYPCH